MEPTNQWHCDTCGRMIESPEDGWVEWIYLPDGTGRDIRIVHKCSDPDDWEAGRVCHFNQSAERNDDGGIVADLQLTEYIGSNGLMRLLAKVAENRLPKMAVLEIIKRIHIPGYEQARLYFDDAQSARAYEPNTFEGFPHDDQIKDILEYVEKAKKRGDLH